VSGCSAGEGVRLEGSAGPSGSASAKPSATRLPAGAELDQDQVAALIRNDPRVGFRSEAVRCPANSGGQSRRYPIDVQYGNLTDTGRRDLLVNLSNCGGEVGLGVYVYEYKGGGYKNVFLEETPPIHGSIKDGVLVITRKVYTDSDAVCCPTGRSITTFAWNGGWFSEVSHSRSGVNG
jgi:hypothetical protein